MKLVIPCRLPGLNDYIDAERRNKYLGAKMKREAEEVIILAAKTQLRGVKLTRPVTMHYTWYEKDKRRDKDNITFGRKLVQDALVKAKILRNDGWGEIDRFYDDFAVDPKNPRVEVVIEEAGHGTDK